MADKRRIEKDEEIKQKIVDAREGRMASIMKVREREKEKKLKVEEFQNRLKTEEAQRIIDKLEYHEGKIAKSNNRNRDCLTMKAETLRRRNQSLSEKVSMFRTAEENLMKETVD